MSTHRRAWIVRSGIVAVLAAAGLFGIASPALAAGEPKLSDISLSRSTIKQGEEVTVLFTVKMSDNQPGSADVSVTPSSNKVACTSTCVFGAATIDAGGEKYQMKFKANGPFTQDEQVSFNIKAGSASNTQQLTVQAAVQQTQAASSVPEVSGVVKDISTGTGISGAKVFIQDSSSLVFETTTDAKGAFKVTSTAERPIKAGVMSFTVEKEGSIENFPGVTKNAIAGQPLTNVQLSALIKTTANPNDTGSANVPAPTDTLDGLSSLDPGEDRDTSGEEGGGSMAIVLILVGAVLVALGVGAIVLLFVRKKKDDGEGDEEDPQHPLPRNPRQGGGPPGGPGGPGGPGRGGPRPPQRRGGPPEMAPPMRGGAPGYDATRPMRPPVSPGPRANNDQTMIAPSPLANAPTQLHSRIPTDHADPYGPPPRHNGGPAGYPPNPPQGGPGPAGTYGAGAGYGQPPANPTSGYPGGAPTYGQGPDQYGQPYGQGPDAYGQGPDGYGPPAGGGYGQGPDQYGQPGYGQQPDPYGPGQGHGGPSHAGPSHGGPGYDGRPDPRAPRPGPGHQPPPTQPEPRRVDWLDD